MLKQGDIVKYATPDKGESQFRFVVLEANGSRITVRWINSGMAIAPTFTHNASEYVLANN